MEPRDRAAQELNPPATSPLRMWGYCLALAAIAFIQAPGRIVGDTKFDLVVDPWGFLTRAAHMWDPGAAFGQVQNQAYGYFWPMGPFFLAGKVAHVPPWIIQRLWWTLLLCLAFVGIVRLCQRLGIGVPWTQVLAGFAFALSPHLATLVGATSVEAWPTALAPWVLLPLVKASDEGSERRAAARSALVVATCGGVNAIAASAVLPLPMLWLLTRTPGPRRRRLLGWWMLFTVLATLWWVVPLLLMGGYSAPFLDYIENAVVTTRPTGLSDVVTGTSDWVSFIAPTTYPAGNLVATKAFLILDAAAVAGLGLAGIARRDLVHRRFLLFGVLAGLVLVGFGYAGAGHGWWAEARQALLDGSLAPFRNLHKYDVVLRLPLVLGLAHLLAAPLAAARSHVATQSGVFTDNVIRAVAVLAMLGLGTPWYVGLIAPAGSMGSVPPYWTQASRYLAEHGGGSRSLALPASAFGDYLWGSPHDDVLQPLARSPWAVRNVVPLAEPGNVVFLDAVTQAAEAGVGSPALARVLAANGVGQLVVRNDLDRLVTGAPDPAVLHQALDRSPGLERVASFGPLLGQRTFRTSRRVRVVPESGLAHRYRAVEVYRVLPQAPRVSRWDGASVPLLIGDPGSALLQGGTRGRPSLLAGDTRVVGHRPVVLTDGLKRREKAFAAVRGNEAATRPGGAPPRLHAAVPNHRVYADQDRWETTEAWRGISEVRASSSQAFADASPPITRDTSPAAALDGDDATWWQSARNDDPHGQWWQVRLERPRVVHQVRVTMGRGAGRVRQLVLSGAGAGVRVDAPPPGGTRLYDVDLGRTSRVRVTAVAFEPGRVGPVVIAEVAMPGVTPQRFLTLPDPPPRSEVTQVRLARDHGTASCFLVSGSQSCHDALGSNGEDGDRLDREFTLPSAATYGIVATGSARPGPRALATVMEHLPVQLDATAPSSRELGSSPLAAVDGDPETTWVSSPSVDEPSLTLRWPRPVLLGELRLTLNPGAPAARPTRLLLQWDDQSRSVPVAADGSVRMPRIRTDLLRLDVTAVEEAFSVEGSEASQLPAGITDLRFDVAEPGVLPGATSPVALDCAEGPVLRVGDRTFPSSVRTTLRTLMHGGALRLTPCGGTSADLGPGRVAVTVEPTDLVRPDRVVLQDVSSAAPAPQREPVGARSWAGVSRSLVVPAHARRSLLVVSENFNPGWTATTGEGRRLASQRVDGWRQGWWLPPSGATTVRLDYAPDSTYRWGLLGGVVAALLVVAAAVRRGRSERLALRTAPARTWELVLVPAAAGVLAGWIGVGVAVVAMLLGTAFGRRREWCGPVAGMLLLVSGLIAAVTRPSQGPADSVVAQLLVVAALGVSFTALGVNGPTSFKRRKGRSRT